MSLSIAIGAHADDQNENEQSNMVSSYSYETNYDEGQVVRYGSDLKNSLLRFTNVTIPNGATITEAHFEVYVTRMPNTDHNVDVYSDVGSTRQDAWSNTSRYETGFTGNSGGPDQTNTSGMTNNTTENITCTQALQDLVDLGGWSSGDTARFALTTTASLSGDNFRHAHYNYTATPDNDRAPVLVVTYTAGGGGANPKGVLGLPLIGRFGGPI